MKDFFKDLDKAFENRVRMGVMSILLANRKADFTHIKEVLQVTDGNLASHLKYLEKEGYIDYEKKFIERKPLTTYKATTRGKSAFKKHIQAIEKMLK